MVDFGDPGWGPVTRTPPWRAELVSPPPHPPAERCKLYRAAQEGGGGYIQTATVLSRNVGC